MIKYPEKSTNLFLQIIRVSGTVRLNAVGFGVVEDGRKKLAVACLVA